MQRGRNRVAPAKESRSVRGLYVQLACFALGTGVLAAWPRDGGDLLLLPIGHSLPDTINLALANDGRIVAAAPSVGGVIVAGDAGHLALPMLRQGTLVIGVPNALCGESPPSERTAA